MASWIDLLRAIGAPLTVSTVALFLAWRPWSRPGPSGSIGRGHWGPSAAVAGGFCAGFVASIGWPHWPPASRWHWVVFAAAAATVPGVLAACGVRRPRGCQRWLMAGLLGAAAMLALHPLPAVGSPWLWRAGLGLFVAASYLIMEPLWERLSGAWACLVLMLVLIAASVLVLKSGFLSLALLTGGLAATLGPALMLSLWRPSLSIAPGGTAAVALLLPLILTIAWFYMESRPPLPIASFALLAAAPAIGWLPWLAGRSMPLQRRIISLLLINLGAATALLLAYVT